MGSAKLVELSMENVSEFMLDYPVAIAAMPSPAMCSNGQPHVTGRSPLGRSTCRRSPKSLRAQILR